MALARVFRPSPRLVVLCRQALALAAVGYGFWLTWHPLAFIIVGGFALAVLEGFVTDAA